MSAGVVATVTVECFDCGTQRRSKSRVPFKTVAEAIETVTAAGWKNAAYFGLKRVEENFYLCPPCARDEQERAAARAGVSK